MLEHTLEIHGFISFTLAIMLLFAGKAVCSRYELLRRYSIPEPVIGGLICALVVAILYWALDTQVSFDLKVRDWLLLYFFAGIGLKSDVRTLLKGGRPLLVLTALASLFIILQNLLGLGMAGLFGLDPKAGLMTGSISLIGGVGTTLAWTDTFIRDLGIGNALEIGVASNTVGLIAACVIGGPIANYLIRRDRLATSRDHDLAIGATYEDTSQVNVSYYDILWAWMWLNLAMMLGYGLDQLLTSAGLRLPMFVSALMAGIILRNGLQWLSPRRIQSWAGAGRGMSLISDICLGMFLTMALMSLKLWELHGMLGFILSTLGLQVVLSVLFTVWVVYRLLGRNYEASVICAGFGGISLGSTATAIVNMSAVTKQYGAAPQAFLVVPLVCGFFIDLINALAIGFFVGL